MSAVLANESSHIQTRVAPPRVARLSSSAAYGRDSAGELHGLPGPGPRETFSICGSGTKPGKSTTTCTKTPREARPVRLAHRLRRIPPGASERGERGNLAHRRLQPRDDRAHRPPPPAFRDSAIFVGDPEDIVPDRSDPTCR